MRVLFEDEADLETLERAVRVLAEIARKDAEGAKGTTLEKIHRDAQARYLHFADRILAVRSRPKPEPPPKNVTPLR